MLLRRDLARQQQLPRRPALRAGRLRARRLAAPPVDVPRRRQDLLALRAPALNFEDGRHPAQGGTRWSGHIPLSPVAPLQRWMLRRRSFTATVPPTAAQRRGRSTTPDFGRLTRSVNDGTGVAVLPPGGAAFAHAAPQPDEADWLGAGVDDALAGVTAGWLTDEPGAETGTPGDALGRVARSLRRLCLCECRWDEERRREAERRRARLIVGDLAVWQCWPHPTWLSELEVAW